MNWNTIEIKIASAEGSQVLHWQLLMLTSDWITWLIEFLGDKLLCGHVPDPFPRCGTGSGHARLVVTMLILYSIQIPATQSFFPPLSCTTPSQRTWQALKLTNYWRYVGTRPLCSQANFTIRYTSPPCSQANFTVCYGVLRSVYTNLFTLHNIICG